MQAPSAVPVGTGATTPTGEIFSYPASLPISKGDYGVGVALGGAADGGLPQAFTNGVTQNLIAFRILRASPADRQCGGPLQRALPLQATIEFTPLGSPAGLDGTAKKAEE